MTWTRPADPASKTKLIASQRFRQHPGRTGVSDKKLVVGTGGVFTIEEERTWRVLATAVADEDEPGYLVLLDRNAPA